MSACGVHPLVVELADALRARGARMACAESCSGGMIAAACTDLAGSSDWFERGIVSYSNEAKVALLGVPRALLDTHGAVSEPVARAMAAGVLASSGTDLAVAVTGVAGPGGGSAAKPVGTVWFGFALRRADGGVELSSERCRFDGDRVQVRAATVTHALQGLLARWRAARPDAEHGKPHAPA
ncbi:MAG: CinA family protein [Ideonella sp.]|nr:CinA family protein [Ideonella sp.]MCC7455857.1 CinA family protein [Nitrospira sp.]